MRPRFILEPKRRCECRRLTRDRCGNCGMASCIEHIMPHCGSLSEKKREKEVR